MTAAETLRVMTFNIRGFYHPGDGANQWHRREAMNLATIRRCAPDLIGIQEVQTGNLKAYQRELREYHWMAWPEYGDQPPYEWPAIYWNPARLRPIGSGGFWLSETPERHSRSWDTDCIRSAAWIALRCVESGATIVHVNTHLDHVSEPARVEGSRLVVERLTELQAAGAAAIITGDFNAVPGSATYRLYRDAGFIDAHVASGGSDEPARSFTNHGWRGYPWDRSDDTPQRIDWILTRDGTSGSVRVRSCEIVRDSAPPVYPSDHFPVIADVEIARA